MLSARSRTPDSAAALVAGGSAGGDQDPHRPAGVPQWVLDQVVRGGRDDGRGDRGNGEAPGSRPVGECGGDEDPDGPVPEVEGIADLADGDQRPGTDDARGKPGCGE